MSRVQIALLMLPVVEKVDVHNYYVQIVVALTTCEMALPLSWCTIARHNLCEFMDPKRGRIVLYGTMPFLNMLPIERWNKFMRGLIKTRKDIVSGIMQRYRRYMFNATSMLTAEPGDLVLNPARSSVVHRAGGYGADLLDSGHYARIVGVAPTMKAIGRSWRCRFNDAELIRLHRLFMRAFGHYKTAHEGTKA